MEDIIKSLSYFGGLIRGKPPVLSPTLENLETLEYIQQPLKPVSDGFCILLHTGPIKQENLEITVPDQGVVRIAVEHGPMRNYAGLWLRQKSVYTLKLPADLRTKELHVEWSDDSYLLVQPVSSGSAMKSYLNGTVLIPKRVHRLLKPTIEVPVLQNMLEEIKDKVCYGLRYMEFLNELIAEGQTEVASGENFVPVDGFGVDEAHMTPEDLEELSGQIPASPPKGEISKEVSLISPKEKMRKLMEISLESKIADDVDKEVGQLLGSLDGENGQSSVDLTYVKVIVLLMRDRLNRKNIASPSVESVAASASGVQPAGANYLVEQHEQMDVDPATAAQPNGAKDSAENHEQMNVTQTATSAAQPDKNKDSCDARKSSMPPSYDTDDDSVSSEEDFRRCLTPPGM